MPLSEYSVATVYGIHRITGTKFGTWNDLRNVGLATSKYNYPEVIGAQQRMGR